MIKGKKVAIFDMDGTLIDSVGIWNEVDRKVIQAIAGHDVSTNEIQKQRDGALRQFSKADNPYFEYCDYLRKKYRASLTVEEIHTLRYEMANEYLTGIIDYKQGAEKVLKLLREKEIILVIATTTKKSNMDIYKTKNKNIAAKAKLDDFFSLIYTREDAREIKPSPEIYLRVASELNVSPADCIIFEDSLIGVEAAKNAGMECVVIYDQYSDHEREQIHALADYAFKDYDQVLAAIESEA